MFVQVATVSNRFALEYIGTEAATTYFLGAPGLEIWSGTEWVALEPVSGAYIVNVGDILGLYTGGEYKSSLHRVMNKSGVERYSIPFFLGLWCSVHVIIRLKNLVD